MWISHHLAYIFIDGCHISKRRRDAFQQFKQKVSIVCLGCLIKGLTTVETQRLFTFDSIDIAINHPSPGLALYIGNMPGRSSNALPTTLLPAVAMLSKRRIFDLPISRHCQPRAQWVNCIGVFEFNHPLAEMPLNSSINRHCQQRGFRVDCVSAFRVCGEMNRVPVSLCLQRPKC